MALKQIKMLMLMLRKSRRCATSSPRAGPPHYPVTTPPGCQAPTGVQGASPLPTLLFHILRNDIGLNLGTASALSFLAAFEKRPKSGFLRAARRESDQTGIAPESRAVSPARRQAAALPSTGGDCFSPCELIRTGGAERQWVGACGAAAEAGPAAFCSSSPPSVRWGAARRRRWGTARALKARTVPTAAHAFLTTRASATPCHAARASASMVAPRRCPTSTHSAWALLDARSAASRAARASPASRPRR